jgi:hypothetical protein
VSNWIGKAGIPFSHGDQLTREICRVLRMDQALRVAMVGGIRRTHVYAPDSTGSFPRMIVASIERTEEGKISHRVKGVHRLGIIVEFTKSEVLGELAEDDPGIDSFLAYVQRTLDTAKAKLNSPLSKMIRGSIEYETISADPRAIFGRDGESLVAFYAGLQLSCRYSDSFPDRAPLELT